MDREYYVVLLNKMTQYVKDLAGPFATWQEAVDWANKNVDFNTPHTVVRRK